MPKNMQCQLDLLFNPRINLVPDIALRKIMTATFPTEFQLRRQIREAR